MTHLQAGIQIVCLCVIAIVVLLQFLMGMRGPRAQ